MELGNLAALMVRSSGRPEVRIGLIDGPVATQHSDLAVANVREISGSNGATCSQVGSAACLHGTFVAGILFGKRSSPAPAICPACTFLIRPIFSEHITGSERMPTAKPEELAAAINDCIDAGANLINLSLALERPSTTGEQALEEALNRAARRSVIIVAAAGNQGTLGSTSITRHPWVIPVVACDLRGRPLKESNLGTSIGRRGLCAPGDSITSLNSDGPPLALGGTSVAAPIVSGAVGLLLSEFSAATAAQIRLAICGSVSRRRASVVPPLLDAEAAYQSLLSTLNPSVRRRVA